MSGPRWMVSAGLSAALLALWLAGCERREDEPPATAEVAPTTLPSAAADPVSPAPPRTQPAAAPKAAAAAEPGSSILVIDGNVISFPTARLKLSRNDGNLTAVLHTADPKNAIDDDYVGNSYYLVMPLDIADPQELGATEWHFRAGGEEEASTTEGIFLKGLRFHLQPSDVVVRFTGTPNLVQLQFMGPQERPWSDFLLFDSSLGGWPRHVQVSGSVFATVEVK